MTNSLKTAALLAGMGALFMAIGGVLGGGTGVTIGLVLGLVMTGFSYWQSDKLAIRSAGAQPVTREQLPQYYAIMEELTAKAGTPMPKLYVSPNPQPNAFATGRNPANAAVCVTEGLLTHLSWDEIRGVLAHELMHIRNRDILIGSVAAAIAMAITFAVNIAQFGMMFGSRDDDRGANPLVLLATIILAPIAAGLLQMSISRTREFKADRTAAQLIGDGEPLARALEKLGALSGRIPANVAPEQASAYIANPLAGQRSSFASWFTTHPPMEQRIARLRDRSWAA
jgi:heat shock protein HtpX